MKKYLLLIIILIPYFAFGQLNITSKSLSDKLSVSISNPNPKPNEFITIKINSFLTDLNKSQISWTVNGELKERGPGKNSLTFQVGELGKSTVVGLEIIKSNGEVQRESYTFIPQEVDILFEPDTTTHPFYKGFPIFSNQSNIRFYAVPYLTDANGTTIPKENIIYKWEINDIVKQDLSGPGRDFYVHNGTLFTRPLKVSVTVSSSQGKNTAKETIFVTPQEPFNVFYEVNPTLGTIYENAISGNLTLNRPELEIISEPTFFSTNNIPEYSWTVNRSSVSSTEKSIVLRNQDNVSGSANVSVKIKNPFRILQSTSDSFNLGFESN